MSASTCRWGIIGTSGIARKNWQSIKNSGNGALVAVASRDAARAETWISENQAHVGFDPRPEAVGGYDKLLERKDIDAVYVPLPTGLRKEWVIRAARAGKHVMCEKPCGVNVADVEEILAECRKAGVQFMDGVMFMHSARLPKLRETIDDGTSIGRLRRISTQFSFMAPEDFLSGNIRMNSDLEPLGCLGDLGWYNIHLTLWVMKYAMPTKVSGRLLQSASRTDSPSKVPMEFSGEMVFPGEVTASFYCSFLTGHQQWACVTGENGHLQMNDFVLPFFGSESEFIVSNSEFDITVCDFNMQRRDRRVTAQELSNSHPTSQETNLFRKFGALVLGGKPDPHWGEIVLKTQKVMMACVESSKQDGAWMEMASAKG